MSLPRETKGLSDQPVVKRILIIDLDNTAVLVGGDRREYPNFLSPKLIQSAKLGAYQGFIICTARRLETFDQIWRHVTSGEDGGDPLIINIVKNFEKATGLPCLGVSTLDDVQLAVKTKTIPPSQTIYHQSNGKVYIRQGASIEKKWHEMKENISLGEGYETYLKPLEHLIIGKPIPFNAAWNGIVPDMKNYLDTAKLAAALCKVDSNQRPSIILGKYNNKNPQLVSIGQHVSHLYPNCVNLLDFVDDDESVHECIRDSDDPKFSPDEVENEATTLHLLSKMSENTLLRTFWHEAKSHSCITPQKTGQGQIKKEALSAELDKEFLGHVTSSLFLANILENLIHFPSINKLIMEYAEWFIKESLSESLVNFFKEKFKGKKIVNMEEMKKQLVNAPLLLNFPIQFIENIFKDACFFKPHVTYRDVQVKTGILFWKKTETVRVPESSELLAIDYKKCEESMKNIQESFIPKRSFR